MAATSVRVPTKSVDFVRRLFPSYRKRELMIYARGSVTFSDLNWSGGTKATYDLVRLDDLATVSLAHWGNLAPWDNVYEGATVNLRPGFLVVETGHFCGKPATMRIYVHPSNVAPLLNNQS